METEMKGHARTLRHSLERHLNAYVLAANAAGVSALALAQPADAKIVYTPAHKQIRIHQKILLDLNHDGITDFEVHLTGRVSGRGGYYFRTLAAAPRGGTKGMNAIWGVESKSNWCAAALSSGIQVGPNSPLQERALLMFRTSVAQDQSACQWQNQPSANLGLRFTIAGKTHFGWARFSTVSGIFLTGYAYETIPNKPIIAGKTHGEDDIDPGPGASLTNPIPDIPQPASLGALALGAPGLSIWRREQSIVAKQ
jgi:hypothetical protein